MAYKIDDIITILWGGNYIAGLSTAGEVTPDLSVKMDEVVALIDELPPITDDETLDALKRELEEIKDRL